MFYQAIGDEIATLTENEGRVGTRFSSGAELIRSSA